MSTKINSVLLSLYALLAAFCIIYFDGTGDAGDSVNHYLYARYAPQHPELFFNHWAKPLFVLLASPFAQFGFIGMKVFNSLAAFFTLIFTYKIAKRLGLVKAQLAPIFLFFSPLYFVLIFSGLTEVLFALMLSIAIYACLDQKFLLASILISFLPFVRSEGLIIIALFGLYFILKKEGKVLPYLLTGHLIYSLAGYFVHDDILWVFTKIPYAKLGSTYGNGNLFHFVDQLFYVVGVPIFILFWIGVIVVLYKSVKGKLNLEIQVLLFLGFFSFFIAHSLFWYLGIFNSMGLKRVLIGVLPLLAIIALLAFDFISLELLKGKAAKIFQVIVIISIFLFPFSSNPAAVNWGRDMWLNTDQLTAIEASEFVKNYVGEQKVKMVYSHPYLSMALDLDPFDPSIRLPLAYGFKKGTKSGDILIWDNWFSVVEHGITKEDLDQNRSLIALHTLKANDEGREIIYSIYQRK